MLEKVFPVKEKLGRKGSPIKVRTFCLTEFCRKGQNHGSDAMPQRDVLDEVLQIGNWLRGELALFGISPMTAQEWGAFPPELKERALRHKPALLGVQHEEGDKAAHMDQYLRELEDLEWMLRSLPVSIDPERNAQRLISINHLLRRLFTAVFKSA